MARLARVVVPGMPHHVTQRGNRRQPTFFCEGDYRAYLTLLNQQYGNTDDVIVFVPGLVGEMGKYDGKSNPEVSAAHNESTHVLYVATGLRYPKALHIAHEVLHHFLEGTVNPGATDSGHDTEGVLSEYDGGSEKLGCKTVKALKKKGVTDADIDQNMVIKQ